MKTLSTLIILFFSVSLFAQEPTMNQIKIESHKTMQHTGSLMALLGFVVGGAGGLTLEYAKNNMESEDLGKVEDGSNMKPWAISMIAAGSTLFLSGVVINVSAGSQIKKLKKLNIGLVYNRGLGVGVRYQF